MSSVCRRHFRPVLEMLEDRTSPAVFMVTNRADAGAGSLRQAVLKANMTNVPDTIQFKVGLIGTIRLTTGEITITRPLSIRGPGTRMITIDGSQNDRIFNIDDMTGTEQKVSISGLTLTRGEASLGGAIRSREDLTLSRMVLTGNRATASTGGAVDSQVGALVVRRSVITGNESATQGGGLRATEDLLVTRSTLASNVAFGYGGGISHGSSGNLTIRFSRLTANTSTTGNGGAIDSRGETLTIENSVIANNRALGVGNGRGGGILAAPSDKSILRRSNVSGNFARNEGGGLLSRAPLTMARCTVSANTTLDGDAGGICQYTSDTLTLTNSTITSNRAGANGGGLKMRQSPSGSLITGCTIAYNTAEANGGGIFLNNGQQVALRNSTISGNRARDNGGGVYAQNLLTDLKVQDATIAFNRAGTDGSGVGGGICALDSVVVLQSTLVAGNLSDTANNAPEIAPAGTSSFSAEFSLIFNIAAVPVTETTAGTVITGKDPRLAPLAFNGGPTMTHALKRGSPAINQGSNPASLTVDQRGPGHPRLLGSAVDIGAFERQ